MNSKNLITAIVILLTLGVLVSVGVLAAYWYYLGPISRQATDWGSFGSVLSGAFTLLSSIATLATLLFLYTQQAKSDTRQAKQDLNNAKAQEEHDIIIQQQLAAQTFDQYFKHRAVFLDRLTSLEATTKPLMTFRNKDEFYQKIFPLNKPTHCDYTLTNVDTGPWGNLDDLISITVTLRTVSDAQPQDENSAYNIAILLWQLQKSLFMEHVAPATDGDIYFQQTNLGINIYSISESALRIEKVLNSILFYAGEKFEIRLTDNINDSIIADQLISYFKMAPVQTTVYIKREITWLVDLEQLRVTVRRLHNSNKQWVLPKTFKTLQELFLSKLSVQRMRTEDSYVVFLVDLLDEIKEQSILYAADALIMEKLKDVTDTTLGLLKPMLDIRTFNRYKVMFYPDR